MHAQWALTFSADYYFQDMTGSCHYQYTPTEAERDALFLVNNLGPLCWCDNFVVLVEGLECLGEFLGEVSKQKAELVL